MGTEVLTIEKSVPSGRLDSYLRTRFPEVSRSTFQRLIEEEQIKVNGRTVKPTHTPRSGETIEITWPEAKPAEAQQQKLSAKSFILATGSKVRPLPGITIDGTSIVGSDEILELKQVPRSLVVIGAGAVGIEFASIFARFGTTVTVIELLPRVLPLEDEEISAEAGRLLAKAMTIYTGAKTEAALKTAHGVEVAFRTSTGEAKSITADMLLVAVGRAP